MLHNKLSMIISTCDKFSDLWDTHIFLLNKNWPDRNIDVFLATDNITKRVFDGVEIVAAGSGKQMPQRIAAALQYTNTEYVLITLDDYFPIFPIDSLKINKIILQMDNFHLDYVRLFKRPNSTKKIKKSDLYEINLWDKKDFNYQVNLYAGIWRRTFLEKTLGKELDAWSYEISLSKIAREAKARCAMSKGGEFDTLDVIRKGKLLHKANQYLKKHKLNIGSRDVISWKEEFRINFFTFVKGIMPQFVINIGKSFLRKFGYKFFSDSADK